ncbi:AT hook motif-containing protein [Salix suchowensis]|nr:AT hook motif-containing protein [Salix suchowensis]
MSEVNQGNKPVASAIIPLKRQRGRPRKYPKLEVHHKGNAHVPRDQNPNRRENAHAVGFGGVNGKQPRQVDPVNDANDSMIGQSVHGIIEATFDAGYLLNVRVGDTETTLRGVVFKPGHYVPVMPENDIAPGVPMIRRNEIPLPRESNTKADCCNPGPRDMNGTAQAGQAANPAGSKGKQVLPVVPQTPVMSRGNSVPVVLQPVNLSSGAPSVSATSQTSLLVPSKVKQIQDADHSSNVSTPTNKVMQFQSQNNHQVMHSGLQSTSPFNQTPAGGLHDAEANPTKTTGVPFEVLLTEVMKRVPASSQSTETNSSSAVNLPVKDSGIVAEKDAGDTDQALSVEPLQVLQPNVGCHPAVASRPSEEYKTGKMTQLLQKVLQESMADNPGACTEEPAAGID